MYYDTGFGKVGMPRTAKSIKKCLRLTGGKRFRESCSRFKMVWPNLNDASVPVAQKKTRVGWIMVPNPDGIPSPLEYLECHFANVEIARLQRIDSRRVGNKNLSLASANVAAAMLRTKKTR